MKKGNKKERFIRMPELEYRKLKRRERQLLMARNHVKIAWQALNKVGQEVK